MIIEVKERGKLAYLTVLEIVKRTVFSMLKVERVLEEISNYQDKIAMKKIVYFLKESENISLEIKTKFLNKELNGNSEEFVERIMLIVNNYDDYKKSTYLGKLFRALLLEKITSEEFFRLSKAINDSYIGDLEWFISQNDLNKKYTNLEMESQKIESSKQSFLSRVEFYYYENTFYNLENNKNKKIYLVTEVGKTFYKVMRNF